MSRKLMISRLLPAFAVTLALSAGAANAAPAVTGDYVESRSANVFVGPCHHEGEIETVGRNAVLAWNITGGEYNGVDLKGVSALAVVAASKSLMLDDTKRISVLYVSDTATEAQRTALVAFLKDKVPAALGEVAGVKTASLTFDAAGDNYRVNAAGIADLKIKKSTEQLCCKQPYKVWGKPFTPVKTAKTGYCVGVNYKDNSILKAWSATDQNNAFYGQFSL